MGERVVMMESMQVDDGVWGVAVIPAMGWRRGRQPVREFEVQQDGSNDGRVGEEGEDLHVGPAGGAEERQHVVDASEELSPTDACGRGGAWWVVRPVRRGSGSRAGTRWRRAVLGLRFGPTEDDDRGAEPGVRSQDAVMTMAVEACR